MSFDLAMPLIFVFSIGSLFVAGCLIRWVLKRTPARPAMRAISDAIKEGAEAFLRRQNRTIGSGHRFSRPSSSCSTASSAATTTSTRSRPPCSWRFWTTLSFVLGARCSVVAGYVGMWVSIRTNIRTASAARTSLNDALRSPCAAAPSPGSSSSPCRCFGVGGLYWLVSHFTDGARPPQIPLLIVGYGFGASFVALFAQLGGGIYTKAADVGADLVGKVEAGHPRGRPAQPRRHRRPRGRQRRRLRGPRRGPLRVHGRREHRRHDPGRDARRLGSRSGHGVLGRHRRRHALPARRPRLRPPRLDRRHLRRQDARGRRTR